MPNTFIRLVKPKLVLRESISSRSPTPDLMSEDMRRERERQTWERGALQEVDTPPVGPVHYQDVQNREVRTHGVGYYAFSKDKEKRAEQMNLLNKLREQVHPDCVFGDTVAPSLSLSYMLSSLLLLFKSPLPLLSCFFFVPSIHLALPPFFLPSLLSSLPPSFLPSLSPSLPSSLPLNRPSNKERNIKSYKNVEKP